MNIIGTKFTPHKTAFHLKESVIVIIVHLSCMFYLFKTFPCLRKSQEDSLPWKHTVVKIKTVHRLYLSDCTEKWLASPRQKGGGNPLSCDWFFLSLSLFRKPQFLSGIRLSWLALFFYSVFFFPPSFTLCFWDGLPPPLFSCHCLSHRLWSECTVSLSAWGAVRAMNGLWEPAWLNSDQLSEKSGC